MDPVTLAAAAVAVLSPYLAKFGESAAEKLGENTVELGGKLLGWMRGKLGAPGQEALDDLAKQPEDADNQAVMRKQLAKALAADPALMEQLTELLPAGTVDNSAMTQDVSGANAKAAQVRGNNNATSIS